MARNQDRYIVGSTGSRYGSAAGFAAEFLRDLRIGPRLAGRNAFEFFVYASLKRRCAHIDRQIRKIDFAFKAAKQIVHPLSQFFAGFDEFRFGKFAFEFMTQTSWIIV